MKASASILISRPVAETFNAFTDIPNRKKYLPEITKLEVTSLSKSEKGVEWIEERMEEGVIKKGKLTISSYNHPRAFTITTHSAGLIFKTRYNFQYAGQDQTKVIVSIGGHPRGLLSGIMNKFLSKNSVYMGQKLQNDLNSFKDVIERRPKTTT